jgi:hypothetical protein
LSLIFWQKSTPNEFIQGQIQVISPLIEKLDFWFFLKLLEAIFVPTCSIIVLFFSFAHIFACYMILIVHHYPDDDLPV